MCSNILRNIAHVMPFIRSKWLGLTIYSCCMFQALLEMADVASAQAMVNYYSERPPQIRARTVYVQFSNHEILKTESSTQVLFGQDSLFPNYVPSCPWGEGGYLDLLHGFPSPKCVVSHHPFVAVRPAVHLCQTLFMWYFLEFFANGFQILWYGDHGLDLELINLSWL